MRLPRFRIRTLLQAVVVVSSQAGNSSDRSYPAPLENNPPVRWVDPVAPMRLLWIVPNHGIVRERDSHQQRPASLNTALAPQDGDLAAGNVSPQKSARGM